MQYKMEAAVEKFIISCSAEMLTNTSSSNLILLMKLVKRKKKRLMAICGRIVRRVPKCKNFADCIEEMPNDVFYSHFRMQIKTFDVLCQMIRPLWRDNRTGRPGIPLKTSLHITLWRLGNQNSFRELSNIFNVGLGAIAILTKLKTRVIKFPNTEAQQVTVMEKFQSLRSHPFPFVLGCIDGTHIKITQPTRNSISYYNRKGTYSIITQAVVDSELRFIDAFVGFPGRCHDASVWHSSPLRQAIVNASIRFPPECHLLGDAAYPLEKFLMVPYKDNGFLTEEQNRFNTILSKTRVCIEQAFGILKKKFRILNFIDVTNIRLVKYIIISCMVLHNIIINNESSITTDSLEDYTTENTDMETEARYVEAPEGALKRNQLATLLSA